MSDLPDDLLLLVLARLRCAASAARTSVLARRWRGLWTSLPALAFRDVAFRLLEPALAQASASSPPAPSLLDIHVPDMPPDGPAVTSLLRSAARLSPSEVVFNLPLGAKYRYTDAELPCFPRATSIKLHALVLFVHAPPAECCFPMLTTLVLSRVTVHGLTAMISRCPCLRVLRFTGGPWVKEGHDITVHSSSLRELVVMDDDTYDTLAECIDITTPMLEQLTLSFLYQSHLSLCVVAPKAEKVSWRCDFLCVDRGFALGFGLWNLEAVSLTAEAAAERRRRPSVVLRMHSTVGCGARAPSEMAREVEKHLQMQVAADLSPLDLELHLKPEGHVMEDSCCLSLG